MTNRWWKTVAGYPATWVVVVVTLYAGYRYFDHFEPGSIGLVLLVALMFISLVAWPVIMSASGTVARIKADEEERVQLKAADLPRLRKQLLALDDRRGFRQLEAVDSKADSLYEVLNERLNAGEMTYARYLTAGRQVQAAVLENLREVVLASKSIRTISVHKIGRRLAELDGASGSAVERERSSLEDRIELHAFQSDRIADLLAQNESLLTAIDRTATALSSAPIGRSSRGAEEAMEELVELAERAKKYASG